MSNKNQQVERLRMLLSNPANLSRIQSTTALHHPACIRMGDDEPWQLSAAEVEAVLHESDAGLSAAVSGSVVVVFVPKPTAE